VASFILAIPLGWLANRFGWLRTPLLTGAGLTYAIPSLPLFIVLPLILGTSARTRSTSSWPSPCTGSL
jgi:osmoprotectant transport system permease protein